MSIKTVIYFLLCCFITSCTGFQEASLSVPMPLVQMDSIEQNTPSLPVMSFRNGIFLNSSTGIDKWVASHDNLSIGSKNNSMVIDLAGVGNDWEQISMRFKPMDFSEAPYLVVKARVDTKSPDSLRLRIDLIDEDGLMTNYTPQERYIRAKSESKLYKFSFDGNWVQNWPFRANVNPKRITEIRINFNGGGPNYTGRMYIDEIIATDGKIKNQNPNNYVLENFDEGVSAWWSANSMTLTAEELQTQNVAKLKLEEAGPAWESFGKRFSQSFNLANTPILRVRLMADAPGKLRMQLADAKDYSTNANPPVVPFPKTEQFTDIYFDFTGRYFQSHPTQQIVDSTQIKMIALFVNAPPEPEAYTGTLIIDEIGVLSVDEYNKLKK